MPSLPRGRDQFAVGAAVLGTGAGVLNLAYAVDWGWVLAVAITPALVVRVWWRSMPGWLLLSWVAVPTVVGDALVVTQSAYLVLTVALAVVAADAPRRVEHVLVVLCLVSPFVIRLLDTNGWHDGIGGWIWFGGLLIGWGFGHLARRQWALIEELERTRTKLAETAVAEDRQRIARELHDLVGHSFSVVLLHLSGARMTLEASPTGTAAVADALRQAEDVGRRGMDELRQALLLMHRGARSLEPFEPGDVERLVEGYRAAGMRVHVEIEGDMDQVSAAPRIVLHDVLREALTNVAKHARTPEAEVRIDIVDDRVTVRVESALGTTPGRAGMGLTGLAHRVSAIDGTFEARPDRARWVVRAGLPRRLAGAAA
ncbi:sensor histidine kinase [Saccharothrix obliqua]|uniref:sensor histidine kinase n=1 Tax=Saccharothrix obliqua TaxID=2861747 RepID=UPI001C6046DE|nr:histidine kinase [Saccharothrix obliqua]MBW4717193.1 hypothetical protein [Saccharothrix obliqua]